MIELKTLIAGQRLTIKVLYVSGKSDDKRYIQKALSLKKLADGESK